MPARESEGFRVVFSGRAKDGCDPGEVQKKLAATFKVDPARVASLFTGRSTVIKKQVDRATAEKYRSAFDRAGAVCHVEPIAESPQKSSGRTCANPHRPSAPPMSPPQVETNAATIFSSTANETSPTRCLFWRVTFSLVGVVAGYALLGFFTWHFAPLPWNQIVNRVAGISTPYEVETEPPSIEVRQGRRPALSVGELEELRLLYESRRFDSLNEKFEALQAAFEEDHSREYLIRDAWWIFDDPPPDQRQGFDAWVEHSPRHFAPYLARAFYFWAKGWESRGSKTVRETSEQQFMDMRDFFNRAGGDLDRALELNRRLLPAYLLRLGIHNARGERQKEDKVFAEARELFPDSFFLYSGLLHARLPRWGGSYREMETLARQALGQAEANPEMYLLLGKIDQDQAWYLRRDKKFDEAVEFYTRALRFGDHFDYLEERGRTYLRMRDLDRALNDVSRAISLRPGVESPYRLRAAIHLHRNDFQGARQDYETASRLAPWKKEVRTWPTWAAGVLMRRGHDVFRQDLEEAVRLYDRALEFDPRHAETLCWRGVVLSRLGRTEKALADIRKSLEYDPASFEACQTLDQLLARQNRWDEIIAAWNSFLALSPDHADAYLERAGAFRQKGDMASALVDLDRACSLGNQEACRIRERAR